MTQFDKSVTVSQLLSYGGSFGTDLLWELLIDVTLYLKDSNMCENELVFLINSEKIHFHDDGHISVEHGSLGDYSRSLHIAPEFYSNNTSTVPISALSAEQMYVYSLGMTIYSASEFNTLDEVELPEALEDVLLGMVQEVAENRITIDVILQECKGNISQKTALRNLIKEFFKSNDIKKAMLPPLPPPAPPKPPSVDTLPSKYSSISTSNPSTSFRDNALELSTTQETPNDCGDVTPYATTELISKISSNDLSSTRNGQTAIANDNGSKGTAPKESPAPSMSSGSEMENPYGTLKPRCRVNDECSSGNCRHTPNELSLMYSTVQKSRSTPKSNKSSSGRVDGFRFDTSISTGSSENEQPIQLTMKNTGKPVIVQFPSNKRYQLPAQREDTVKSVFTSVIQRLGIEDASLFALQLCPVKGIREFVASEHKLKTYATDKWKSDTVTSPPLELRLAVKFYPPNPHMFVNQVTRLQYFLGIRTLILDGTYEISKEVAFDLAALSLQADVGDYYDQSNNNYFEPHNYVPPDVMSIVSYQYCSKEIPMLHSKLDDMSQNEAIIRYLQIACNLPDYGIHFFEVVERSPQEGEHSWVGVSLEAVVLYKKSSANPKTRGPPTRRFEWHEIGNISYKNKTFILDIVAADRKAKSERRHAFETDSTKVSRQIMGLCADTHKFYIKIKDMLPKSPSKDPTFSVRDYTPSPKSVITNKERDGSKEEEEEEEDTGDTGITRTKSVSRPEALQHTKRPPPNDKLVQKYVCLTKSHNDQSLGMTIVGGDGNHGIYVEHLAPRGLANLDGRIKPGDMLLSVNGTGLKSMTHQQAVELITQQSNRVELELVERAECHGDRVESDSNNSIEVDYIGDQKKLNKSTSLPSVTSSSAPWFVRASKYAGRLPSNTPQSTLLSNDSRMNGGAPVPESLQNRMNMQDRYNLVRRPQQSTTLPRGHSSPGHSTQENNLSQGEDSGISRSAENIRTNGDHIPINGKLDNVQLVRRLTRGSSEQIPVPKEEQGSYYGSFVSDNKDSHSQSSASFTNSDGGKTEASHSSSKVPSSRDPFSRIFSVYLTKQRSSLGMSIRVDRGAVFVRDVVPHGPAAASGMIEKGDTILSVNGVDVSSMSHQEAVNVLQTAPTNVTLVMSWGTAPSHLSSKGASDYTRTGMQFRVTLHRNELGFGFNNRSTYMGHESFVRIKTVHEGGPADIDGTLEEGDILLSSGGYSLENVNDRILVNILTSVSTPTEFIVYRPDTIRTFNPRKYEAGRILPVTSLPSEELLAFILCPGYPYYKEENQSRNLLPNDRLLRVGKVCCQGIKSPQLQSIISESNLVGVQIFRPDISADNENQSSTHLEKELRGITLSEPTIAQLMENAETITLEKKEQGLGFSLLGQQDGKRIVRGVTVKTVLEVGAAHEEGRLAPGDLIIMVNGQSMVGVTQSKALRIIRKCTGQVVLTVVPGPKRDLTHVSSTERKLIGLE